MADKGYKNIRCELPNLDLMEIPKIIEQVPMPQMNELIKTSTAAAYQNKQKDHYN